MAEVLVYSIIALLLGFLLVRFLQGAFSYYAYMQDKVKLTQIAGSLVRDFKRNLRSTVAGNIQTQIIEDEGKVIQSQVTFPLMEATRLDQTMKWQDELVHYRHDTQEQKVYRWRGGQDSVPANDPKKKSWPYVEKFVVTRDPGSRDVSFLVMMQFEDRKKRTHRYQTEGSVEVMGGFPVQ